MHFTECQAAFLLSVCVCRLEWCWRMELPVRCSTEEWPLGLLQAGCGTVHMR